MRNKFWYQAKQKACCCGLLYVLHVAKRPLDRPERFRAKVSISSNEKQGFCVFDKLTSNVTWLFRSDFTQTIQHGTVSLVITMWKVETSHIHTSIHENANVLLVPTSCVDDNKRNKRAQDRQGMRRKKHSHRRPIDRCTIPRHYETYLAQWCIQFSYVDSMCEWPPWYDPKKFGHRARWEWRSSWKSWWWWLYFFFCFVGNSMDVSPFLRENWKRERKWRERKDGFVVLRGVELLAREKAFVQGFGSQGQRKRYHTIPPTRRATILYADDVCLPCIYINTSIYIEYI